jgi:hypothetical protein
MTKTLPVQTLYTDGMPNYHAGEFTHAGNLFSVGHVPTRFGWRWVCEKQTPGGFVRIPATFRHDRRKSILTVTI